MLGNTIVLVPILLNSHPGTKYGIPFPVFARAAYGTIGSNLPALMRALVACGWFGIQAWIGGEALNTFFANVAPGLADAPRRRLRRPHDDRVALVPALLGPQHLHHLPRHGPAAARRELGRAVRAGHDRGAPRLGDLARRRPRPAPRASPGKFTTAGEFFKVFVPSLTAMIGFWATLSLNMPDFTRFGRSQREQVVGQVVALPTTMFVFAAMGVMITSATAIIYGELIWDPIKLIGKFQDPFVIAISMFTAVVATLAVNIAANVVSPANDFANAFPRAISFKTGGLITGILGIVIMPWQLLADPSGYIFTWLLGYSGGLGSIAGVLIADYWIVRKTRARLEDLYLPDGAYRYTAGWHMPGVGRHARRLRRRLGRARRFRRCARSTTTRGSSGLASRSRCIWLARRA